MDIQKERTLAYKLAKSITSQDLSDISGGASLSRFSQKTTLVPSGNNINQLDPILDASVDW